MTFLLTSISIILCVLIGLKYKNGWLWEDLINPVKWKKVAIFLLKKLLRILGDDKPLLNKYEILTFAYRAANCTDCLIEGKCVNCKCDTEGLFNDFSGKCSLNKFGASVSNTEMQKLIDENKLELNFKIIKKDV